MTNIKLLSSITNPTKDGFIMPACTLQGCSCHIRLDYPSSTRVSLHKNIGDTLSIGTIAQCKAGTKDIVQLVADGFISLGWAKAV